MSLVDLERTETKETGGKQEISEILFANGHEAENSKCGGIPDGDEG
jgi:hypothetical protein